MRITNNSTNVKLSAYYELNKIPQNITDSINSNTSFSSTENGLQGNSL